MTTISRLVGGNGPAAKNETNERMKTMNKYDEAMKANPDAWKIYADVVRPDGHKETVDLSARFFSMNEHLAQKIKADTAKSGRGEVVRIWRKIIKTNEADLARAYNNLNNEGGEGYVPDFSNDPRLTVEVATEQW